MLAHRLDWRVVLQLVVVLLLELFGWLIIASVVVAVWLTFWAIAILIAVIVLIAEGIGALAKRHSLEGLRLRIPQSGPDLRSVHRQSRWSNRR